MRPGAPSRPAGRLRGVQPAAAQVLSLLQPPGGGCAVPTPERPKRKGDAGQPDGQQHATEHVCPAEHGREHLRDDPDRAGRRAQPRKPSLGDVPRIRRRSPAGRRGSAEPRSRPSSRAIRTSAPAVKGARSAAVAAAAHLPLSRTIASDPSPVVRHANDTAQDARRAGSMDICVAIERPLADGGAHPVRAARRGVRQPAACGFPFPG